jgi:nucleoside-diphosphate-sugar epimerase
MTRTVLVTGANGLVGQAACRHLARNGWRVLAGVREGRAAPEGCERRPAPDLTAKADWRPALEGATHVLHAAARVHQMGESPATAQRLHNEANRDGTLALAEQAGQMGVERFVFVSTAKVMGEHNPPGRPFRDEDAPSPEDAYAQAKRQAELGLLSMPGLSVAILRPPLVYGPGAGANLEALIRLIAKGVPLPFSLIRNKRSLIGLGNLISALETLLVHPQASGRAFLIRDLDVSTPELIRLLARAMGMPARLWPLMPGLMKLGAALLGKSDLAERILGSLWIDDASLRRDLGWHPAVSPEDEIGRWLRSDPSR